MRDERRTLGAALLGAALASAVAPAGAQQAATLPPLPPLPAGSFPGEASPVEIPMVPMDQPVPPPMIVPALPPPVMVDGPIAGPLHVHRPGPIGRAFHHAAFAVKDRMVGEPSRFVDPPVGWTVGRHYAAQEAMAEQHTFTLYRSDFFAGTDRLTPDGLRRFGRMMSRWDCWAGPMLVEADPRRPGLAESRRLAVLNLASGHGDAIDPGRLVVGGSPYLGERGDLAEIYNNVMLDRSARAPAQFPLNPILDADFGGEGSGQN